MTDTNEAMSNEPTNTNYKKVRATIKSQVTRVRNFLERVSDNTVLSLNEINLKIERLKKCNENFDEVQKSIELLTTTDVELENETIYRNDFEESIDNLFVKLMDMKDKIEMTDLVHNSKTDQKNVSLANIHFTPYTEDETFSKRLEIFMLLKNITSEQMKTYILLHALTPQLHQRVYDLCAPDDPLSKDYNQLVKLLECNLDPKPSIWALHHNFISRVQDDNESITNFATELKKLTVKAELKCACGKLVADMLMILQ